MARVTPQMIVNASYEAGNKPIIKSGDFYQEMAQRINAELAIQEIKERSPREKIETALVGLTALVAILASIVAVVGFWS